MLVVWLALKSDAVVLDQALTRFAALCEPKRTSHVKFRFVQDARARLLRITRRPLLGARGDHGLSLVLALRHTARVPRQFPLARCHETNVCGMHPFNCEGELVKFLFGDFAVG